LDTSGYLKRPASIWANREVAEKRQPSEMASFLITGNFCRGNLRKILMEKRKNGRAVVVERDTVEKERVWKSRCHSFGPLQLSLYSGLAPAQLRLSYGAGALLTRKTSQDYGR
jgi:hypothetical protein